MPVPGHQRAGLAGLAGEFLELGRRHPAHVQVGQQGPGQGDEAEPEPEVARAVVAFDVAGLFQGGGNARDAALVQVDLARDFGNA